MVATLPTGLRILFALATLCFVSSADGSIDLRLHSSLDYAVLGQQKSGTSTLWMHLKTHPDIAWVTSSKETLYFHGELNSFAMCDNDLELYHRHVLYTRAVRSRNTLQVGDWSATHLSCLCCPVVFKTLNPAIKLIAVLRDPIHRTLSRFLEQKVVKGPYHNQVVNKTFSEYVEEELRRVRYCLSTAASYGAQPNGAAQQQQHRESLPRKLSAISTDGGSAALGEASPAASAAPPRLRGSAGLAGWGAGMDLAAWMSAQCFARSNIVGWSAYDIFLDNYLAHFPKEQLLVLYTEDLAREPLAVVRRVETFLGLPPGNYSEQALGVVYNSRGCYRWDCGLDKTKVPLADPGKDGETRSNDSAIERTKQRLAAFFGPHVLRLRQLADQGAIAPVPDAWLDQYRY